MHPIGDGKRKVLVVGEAPGRNEDDEGKPFVGASGELLRDILYEIGVDLERDCWVTNSIICRPINERGGNKTPTKNEVEYCRPNLFNTIEKYKPNTVILLGGIAVSSLIGSIWDMEAGEGVSRWVGWQIPLKEPEVWACPTWHPAYLLREEKNKVLRMCFKDHLKRAFDLKGKAWGGKPPNFKSKVNVVINPEEAAKNIYELIDCQPKLAALDYETTTLKPDGKNAQIVCCSLSDGNTTLTYPWYGPTVKATKEFIRCKEIGKIASNMKFEERWTRKEFGHGVRNWKWDTMLAAHTLDNRSGISGLKFQSLVLLGQEAYNDHISPYLKSVKTGCNEPNRIRELAMRDLLLYCGLDSLLEVEVAKIQMRNIGVNT
jgi:uracil-DNA glycosylase family 4